MGKKIINLESWGKKSKSGGEINQGHGTIGRIREWAGQQRLMCLHPIPLILSLNKVIYLTMK